MGDVYEIFRDGVYLGTVLAFLEEEAIEEALQLYGPGEYVAKVQVVQRVAQARSGRRGKAW